MVRAISDNNDSTAGKRRDFTPKSATKMLPLVRHIVADIQLLSASIESQREQLRGIDELPETSEDVDYREELSDIRASLEDDEKRLDACLRELTALGLEAHVPFEGSVDFPAVMNRRSIRLCWHTDDKRVEFWHEIGQSKDQRKKVDPQMFGFKALN